MPLNWGVLKSLTTSPVTGRQLALGELRSLAGVVIDRLVPFLLLITDFPASTFSDFCLLGRFHPWGILNFLGNDASTQKSLIF